MREWTEPTRLLPGRRQGLADGGEGGVAQEHRRLPDPLPLSLDEQGEDRLEGVGKPGTSRGCPSPGARGAATPQPYIESKGSQERMFMDLERSRGLPEARDAVLARRVADQASRFGAVDKVFRHEQPVALQSHSQVSTLVQLLLILD